LEKDHSTCLELLLQLSTRVYLLVLVWISRSKVNVFGSGICEFLWLGDNDVTFSMVKQAYQHFNNFKFIEIMGENDPYQSFLGIDWAYENFVVIDLKKEIMSFEGDGMKVTQPLDLYQGPHYRDTVEGNMEEDTLDHLYTMSTGNRADYINPTIDGSVSWNNIQFAGKDLEVAFDNWKHGIYENLSRCCVTIIVSRWIGSEVRGHPVYNGTSYLASFLVEVEAKVA
jgi:hypothetical protein